MPTVIDPARLARGLMPRQSLFVFFGVLSLGTLSGCGGAPQQETAAKKDAAPAKIETVPVRRHDLPQTVRVQGSFHADEHAVVGVKVTGRVDTVAVDIGTRVKRGAALAALDLDDFKLRIKEVQAELASVRARLGLRPGQPTDKLDRTKAPLVLQEKANLDGADANYRRAATLVRNGGVSPEEYQLRETALKVAEAKYTSALHQVDETIALLEKHASALKLAENALTDATVTAPFDGIVAARHIAPGVYLQVGDPVVTLVRTDPLRFHAGVPERHALQVRRGQEVIITVQGQSSPVVGKVTRISPVLNMASRSLPIEVDVPNADLRLRAGLFAEADIVIGAEAQAVMAPRGAVVEFAGVEKVCVVKDGQAELRRVVTGRKVGDLVEIVEGLTTEDEIALNGQTARPGPAVAVRVPTPDGNSDAAGN
jgi:RND family efflux transporter MFP subunit